MAGARRIDPSELIWSVTVTFFTSQRSAAQYDQTNVLNRVDEEILTLFVVVYARHLGTDQYLLS
jgi:hypothetical protein